MKLGSSIKMTIQYSCKNLKEIRVFGDKFVKNNKKNFSIYIKEKKHELVPNLIMKDEFKTGDYLIINIKLEKIKNMSFMFYGCSELKSIVQISDFTKHNINSMGSMFYNCTSLEYQILIN